MNCAVCKECQPHPDEPTRCIYGGPYSGYVPASVWYELPGIKRLTLPPDKNPRYWSS